MLTESTRSIFVITWRWVQNQKPKRRKKKLFSSIILLLQLDLIISLGRENTCRGSGGSPSPPRSARVHLPAACSMSARQTRKVRAGRLWGGHRALRSASAERGLRRHREPRSPTPPRRIASGGAPDTAQHPYINTKKLYSHGSLEVDIFIRIQESQYIQIKTAHTSYHKIKN